MSLKFFGAVTQFDPAFGASGYTSAGYPDPNNIPLQNGIATGHQFPWNIMRNDNVTAVIHESFVGYPGGSGYASWDAAAGATQTYCKNNNVTLFGYFSGSADGWQGWSYSQTQLNRLVPYLSGISCYLILFNEIITTTGSATNGLSFSFSDLGATPIAGFIQFIKNVRGIVPATCKLGMNDYSVCDQISNENPPAKLSTAIAVYQACAAGGAALDFLGAESYWQANNYNGYSSPVAAANSFWNQFGSATGVPIILSEFTPYSANKGAGFYAQPNRQINQWQGLVEAAAANQNVIGVTGPWGGIRVSAVWNGSSGEANGGQNWMWNDTGGTPFGSEAPNNDPNGSGVIGPGAVTSTLSWLQGWVPANVGGSSPNPEFVQLTEALQATAATSLSATYQIATVPGDLLAAGVAVQGPGLTCTGFSDSANGAWTLLRGPVSFGSTFWSAYMFYFANAKSITQATAAWSGTVGSSPFPFGIVVAAEYKNITTSSPVDVSNSASGNNATPSVSVTTVFPSDILLVFGATFNQFNGAGAGFTNRLTDIGNGILWDDRLVSAGTYSDAPRAAGSGQWSMIVGGFEIAGFPPGSVFVTGQGPKLGLAPSGLAGQINLSAASPQFLGFVEHLSGSISVSGLGRVTLTQPAPPAYMPITVSVSGYYVVFSVYSTYNAMWLAAGIDYGWFLQVVVSGPYPDTYSAEAARIALGNPVYPD